MTTTYLAAHRDAGLLREYITRHYGQTLRFGGDSERFFRGERLVRRLAKSAGLSYAAVRADIVADVDASECD
jgi:hypothetical protein